MQSGLKKGLLLGGLAVTCFSFTLPATKAAVSAFPAWNVALGRVALAGAFSWLILAVGAARGRERRPTARELRSLVLISLCLAIGYNFLLAWALARTSASHAAVVLALQPLATALLSRLRLGERPSARFWGASAVGAAISLAYFLSRASGPAGPADLAILATLPLLAVGYVEAGALARELGAMRVTLWTSALPSLAVLPLFVLELGAAPLPTDPRAWGGLLYVGLVSQVLATVPWYRGLALGGAARVGQVQLLQPFLTLLVAAWLLGEPVSAAMLVTAAGVVGCLVAATPRGAQGASTNASSAGRGSAPDCVRTSCPAR